MTEKNELMQIALSSTVWEVAEGCESIIDSEANRRSVNRTDLAEAVAIAILLRVGEARVGK